MLHKSFKPAKCKTSLKMAVSRIKLLKNKRDAQVKHLKRELAQLLESGQDQTARIRVEHVVREEKTMAAYDLVEIYCELIAARLPIIESQKNCPIDLKEAIASVIFASPRCADIPELMDVRKHLTAKYGKEFVTAALELRPDCGVSRLLVEKLSAKAPDGPTKVKILHTIAEEHNVKWEPKSFEERELKPHEDLLNGPNSFEKSSKSYVDPPKSQPSSSHDETRAQLQTYGEQGPPSGQVPPQPMEKINMPENFNNHSTRVSSSSLNFDHSNDRDSKHGLSVAYHPGSGAGGMKHEDTYSLDGSLSGSRKNWTMEFKDATAAAQAAAESAERASMAARAAAQLSSRGSSTMQYSAESSKASQVPTYLKQNYSSSTLQSPPVAGDSAEHSRPENITRQYSVESHESSVDIPRDEPQNYVSPTMHSHVTGKSENLSYNQRKPRMTHGQIGSFEHNHSDEDENLASVDYKSSSLTQVKPVPASFTSRLSFGNLQTPDAYSPQKKSETNGDLGYSSIDRKKSDKFEMPFTREPPDIRNSENVDYHEFDDQEQSGRDVSYSHTYAYSDDRDIFSNVTQHPGKSYDEDTFVASDRESSQRYTDETKLHANASAVFDDYGSDNDENIIDWENNHMKQVYSDVDNFPSSVDRSSNSPFRGVNSQTRQDVEATRASMEESDIFTKEKYAQIFSKSSTRSGHDSQANELPVTFDDSDSHDSESEEELRRSKLMNVGDGSVSRDQRAASHEVTADFVLAESAEIVEDVVSSKTPSLVSGSELNFGTLTGGLRNKGYRNPPYSKVPADSGLAKETSTKMENVVEPSVSAVSHTEKVYVRQEIQGTRYDLSTSEDDSEDELQKYTSTSSRDGYSKYNKASTKVPGPSLNSVYTDEEDFHQKPLEQKTRPNTGFSRRTKPSPSYLKQSSKNTSTVSPKQHVVVFDPVDNSSSLSHGVEALGKREVQGNRTEIRRSLQEPVVSSHTTSRPASESKRSSIDETSWLSERKPSSSKAEPQEQSSDHRSGFMLPKVSEKGTNKQVLETNNAGLGGKPISSTKMVSPMGNQSSKGSGREGSSRDQPTHVHPKLPDYDTLAARLQSLRQNRQ